MSELLGVDQMLLNDNATNMKYPFGKIIIADLLHNIILTTDPQRARGNDLHRRISHLSRLTST